MNTLKVGVMGCANIAIRTVIPTMKAMSNVEVIAVASRDKNKAKKTAAQFGCRAVTSYENLLLDDSINAIYMPLPTGLHEEWVLKALRANKHILVEKSLAMNFVSAQKMVAEAKARSLLIMENFMFLYHSQHQAIIDRIDAGEIGEIRSFRSSFGFPPLDRKNFRYNKALGGGALLDAAAYTIRASQLFLGNDLNVTGASLFYDKASGVDVFGGAFLKTSSGLFSEVAFGFDNYYQCNYEIWGSKGKLIAQKSFTPKPNEKPILLIEQQDYRSEIALPADDHFMKIITEFSLCIDSGSFNVKYAEILNQARLLQDIRDIAE